MAISAYTPASKWHAQIKSEEQSFTLPFSVVKGEVFYGVSSTGDYNDLTFSKTAPLTTDQSPLQVVCVARKSSTTSIPVLCKVVVYYTHVEGFTLEFTTTYPDEIVDFPIESFGNFTIDWGDGSIVVNPSYYSHTYSTVGTYTAKATGKISGISRGIRAQFTDDTITKIKSWGDSNLGISYINTGFKNCRKLKSPLPANSKGALINVVNFKQAFMDCRSLDSITNGVFNGCTLVVSFESTFAGCLVISTIPSGLFDSCTAVTSFSNTFFGCSGLTSIPAGLFGNNTAVTNFESTFSGCSGLTSIPTGLFDSCTVVTNFSYTFYFCYGLTSIPSGLFDNCTAVTSFGSTFYYCYGLTSIPSGLFDSCTVVTNFSYTFYNCNKLTSIPSGLFDNITLVTNFDSTFSECSGLTSIPTGLFDNCILVTKFYYTFYNCYGLTSIPSGLFDNNTAVTNFDSTFYNCNKLTSIPSGLFDNCTEVEEFNYTFSECSGLTSIPAGLFGNNTKVKSFESIFYGCLNIVTIPSIVCTNVIVAQLNMFKGCSKLTNFGGLIDMNESYFLGDSPLLTVTSLMNCINGLRDRSATTQNHLGIGATNLAKLTPAQIAVATAKNWTITA